MWAQYNVNTTKASPLGLIVKALKLNTIKAQLKAQTKPLIEGRYNYRYTIWDVLIYNPF